MAMGKSKPMSPKAPATSQRVSGQVVACLPIVTDVDPKSREKSYYNFPADPVEIRVQVGKAKPEVKSTTVATSNGSLDTSTEARFSCRAGQ